MKLVQICASNGFDSTKLVIKIDITAISGGEFPRHSQEKGVRLCRTARGILQVKAEFSVDRLCGFSS